MLAYLEAENKYTEAMLAHTEALQSALYDEMKSRIKETDESAPMAHGATSTITVKRKASSIGSTAVSRAAWTRTSRF